MKKNLTKIFILFLVTIIGYLFCYISKKPEYLSIQTKFNKYTQNSIVVDVPNNQKLILQSIIQKVKIVISNFSENYLKIKMYNHIDKQFVYSENNYYIFLSITFK